MLGRTVTYSSAEKRIPRQAVIDAALRVGCAAVSWSTGEIKADVARLLNWQTLSMHGEMQFMGRAQHSHSDSVGELLISADKTPANTPINIISLIFPYHAEGARERTLLQLPSVTALPMGFGRVARYATGPDYHKVLPEKLAQFTQILQGINPSVRHQWRSFTDSVPLLERAWARKAELGFAAKNTMLIRPGVGSFFFIAEVITSAEIEGEGQTVAAPQGCGTCSNCAAACPTAALQTPYRLDARRCISYLTIEKRGLLAEWERRAIGEWVFGCDICQEVCPFNHHPAGALAEFTIAKIPTKFNLKEIFALQTNALFLARCGGTPLERTRRAGLVRNAICVAVNRESSELITDILQLALQDPSPTVRATAVWGARELLKTGVDTTSDYSDQFALVLKKLSADENEDVRGECLSIMRMGEI